MELIKKPSDWFSSQDAVAQFEKLSTLEERAVFVYSYFKAVAHKDWDKEDRLFAMAFVMADTVYSSSLTYAKYPDLIDPEKNPFVSFVVKANGGAYSPKNFLAALLMILHGKVDPFDASSWIYIQEQSEEEALEEKLTEVSCPYVETRAHIQDAKEYQTDETLQAVQLAFLWAFGKQVKE